MLGSVPFFPPTTGTVNNTILDHIILQLVLEIFHVDLEKRKQKGKRKNSVHGLGKMSDNI